MPAVPANVVTLPPASIFRIVWLPLSATYRLPAVSPAMPRGALKRADANGPSADPGVPARPPTVVTTPADVARRIVWLPLSVTSRLLPLSMKSPATVTKRAAEPVPSAVPDWISEPAKVVTLPLVDDSRIAEPSATKTLPALSAATLIGDVKRALSAAPSIAPGPPMLPATRPSPACGSTISVAAKLVA